MRGSGRFCLYPWTFQEIWVQRPIVRKFRRGIKIYTTSFLIFTFLANKWISVVKDYNILTENRNTTWSSEFPAWSSTQKTRVKGGGIKQDKGMFFLQIHQGSPTWIKEKPLKRKLYHMSAWNQWHLGKWLGSDIEQFQGHLQGISVGTCVS